jgi:hypothetical protein
MDSTTGADLQPDHDDAIDRLARQAGADVRRPAPESALGAVQRSARHRRVARTVAVSACSVALIGAFVVVATRNGDQRTDVVTATDPSTVAPTVPATASSVASSVPSTSVAPTTAPPSTVVDPGAASAAPGPVYHYNPMEPGAELDPNFVRTQSVVDPLTGEVIEVRGLAEWEPQYPSNSGSSSSGIEYITGIAIVDFDYPFPSYEIDPCRQIRNRVTASGSAFPEWSVDVRIDPTGTFGVVVTTECPVDGRITDEFGTGTYDFSEPLTYRVSTFDPDRPEVAPTVVVELPGSPWGQQTEHVFTADGSAAIVVTDSGLLVITPGEIRTIDSACAPSRVQTADTGSKIAYVETCADGSRSGVVLDLASDQSITIPLVGVDESFEMDPASIGSPAVTWTMTCTNSTDEAACVIRQGETEVNRFVVSTDPWPGVSFRPRPQVGD